MKSNKLFMAILLGGMLSSGVSFGMDVGPQKGGEPTPDEKLISFLVKHKNKVALIALLAPTIYTAMSSGSHPNYGSWGRIVNPRPLGYLTPLMPYILADDLWASAKQNPGINVPSLLAATALGGYMAVNDYVSNTTKALLNRPEVLAKETNAEKIQVLKGLLNDCSWYQFWMKKNINEAIASLAMEDMPIEEEEI
jgi:hypothetical protein